MKRILVTMVLGAGVLWGCGGDDGGGPSVPATTTLGAVTEAQVTTLCKGLVADLNEAVPLESIINDACVQEALKRVGEGMIEPTVTACESFVTPCEPALAEKVGGRNSFVDDACTNTVNIGEALATFGSADCMAVTVADAESCIEPWLVGLGASYQVYSCDLATDPAEVDGAVADEKAVSLQGISDDCLEFLQKCVGPALRLGEYIPTK